MEIFKQPEGLLGALIAILVVLDTLTRPPKKRTTDSHEIVVRFKA